jgi:hypothetical protein
MDIKNIQKIVGSVESEFNQMRMASHFKQQQIRIKKQRTLETEHT